MNPEFPAWINREVRLRPYPDRILSAILRRCRDGPLDEYGTRGFAVVSVAELAREVHVSPRTAAKHIRNLRGMGVLSRVNRGGIMPTGEVSANCYVIPGIEGCFPEPECQKTDLWGKS